MDKIRIVLVTGLIIVGILLAQNYVKFKASKQPTNVNTSVVSTSSSEFSLGETESNNSASEDIPSISSNNQSIDNKLVASTDIITVETNTLIAKIDPKGGTLVFTGLKDHAKTIDDPNQPFVILENNDSRTYIAQSGLIGKNGTDKKSQPLFASEKTQYVLEESDNEIKVNLSYVQQGVNIIKQFVFKRDQYLIDINYIINNTTDSTFEAAFYGQIKRDSSQDPAKDNDVGGMGMQPYLGFALTTNDENFEKIDFDDLEDGKVTIDHQGGWIAMVQHYFLSAWIDTNDAKNTYELLQTPGQNMNIARIRGPIFTVAPQSEKTISYQFYSGPKDQYKLENIAENLDLSVDYGFLWMFAQPLYALLHFFNEGTLHIFGNNFDIFSGVGNWGFSIILLTVLVKILFFGLNAKAYRSMAKMRAIQPKMLALKDKYPDDRQRQSKEMMQLYAKEGVNPIGGCLPMIVQMPVFISLYWVLMESVELRHAPFIGYIHDLSAMDPYFIMPLIMGVSMWFQQRLNPPPPDPMQAKVMQFLPVIFTFFFLFFPSGLVLYWVVNNILSIAQQWVITKRIEAETKK